MILLKGTVLIVMLAIAGAMADDDTVRKPNEFAVQNENFAINFYKEMIKDPKNKDKSVIFSPVSIQTLGALLYAGAHGLTAEEMQKGFRLLSNDPKVVAESFMTLLDKNDENPIIKMANKVYIADGYTIAPTFNEIAIKSFHSGIENIVFGKSVEAVGKMNKWVEENTGGKIKDFLKNDAVDSDTRMFLLNAIYFKGEWVEKFKTENTEKEDFYVTPTETIKVDMMRTTSDIKLGFFNDIGAKAAELPFRNSDLSLFVLVPTQRDQSLTELEENLSSINLQELSSKLNKAKAQILLPKFKIELQTDMEDILKSMNMRHMFGTDANFRNLLTSLEPLTVSKALHKAVMEINEEGAEASASTGFGIRSRTGPPVFVANQSFLYFIKGSNGEIYFMGRFTGK